MATRSKRYPTAPPPRELPAVAAPAKETPPPPIDFQDFFAGPLVEWICVGMVLCHIIFGTGLFSYVCPWTPWEACWFAVVTMTTVGYGDFIPNETNTQKLFGIFYIWLSISVIAACVGILAGKAVANAEEGKFSKLISRVFGNSLLTKNLVLLFIVICIGVVIFPNIEEDWSYVDGFYFVTVTLSSVGYGSITPVTWFGRFFGMFYLLVGVVVTSNLVSGIISQWMDDRKEAMREAFFKRALTPQSLAKIGKGKDSVTKLDFLSYMLSETGLCDAKEINIINQTFDKLDVSRDGALSLRDLELRNTEMMDIVGAARSSR